MCLGGEAPPPLWQDTLSLRASFPAVKRPFPAPEGAASTRSGRRARRGRAPVALAGRPGRSFSAPRSFCACAQARLRYALPVPGGQALRSAFRKRSPVGLFRARRSLARRRAVRSAMPRRAATLSGRREALLSSGAEETLVRAPCPRDISPRTGRTWPGDIVSGSGWTIFRARSTKDRGASARTAAAPCFFCRTESRHRRSVHNGRQGKPFSPAARTLESVLSLNECTLAVLLAEWEAIRCRSQPFCQARTADHSPCVQREHRDQDVFPHRAGRTADSLAILARPERPTPAPDNPPHSAEAPGVHSFRKNAFEVRAAGENGFPGVRYALRPVTRVSSGGRSTALPPSSRRAAVFSLSGAEGLSAAAGDDGHRAVRPVRGRISRAPGARASVSSAPDEGALPPAGALRPSRQ